MSSHEIGKQLFQIKVNGKENKNRKKIWFERKKFRFRHGPLNLTIDFELTVSYALHFNRVSSLVLQIIA